MVLSITGLRARLFGRLPRSGSGLTIEALRQFDEERQRGPNEKIRALYAEYRTIKAAEEARDEHGDESPPTAASR